MIKAIIFDMDGTMFDTELLWRDINTKFAAKYNTTMSEETRKQMMGRKDIEALAIFKRDNNISAPIDDLVEARRELILEDISIVKEKEGLYELLDRLEKFNIKKAIATSSFTKFVEQILAKFNLESRFDAIVTGDDVTMSKPNPAIFLEAAKLLQVSPHESLVIEDAQNGVEAGYNAHMKTIAIPHAHSHHHDFSKATRVLSSMDEITIDLLRSL